MVIFLRQENEQDSPDSNQGSSEGKNLQDYKPSGSGKITGPIGPTGDPGPHGEEFFKYLADFLCALLGI